jgi:hypothetical protein
MFLLILKVLAVMKKKLTQFAIFILGIGIFSTFLSFGNLFLIASANAQQMHMGQDNSGDHGMGGGGPSGMGGGGPSGMGGGGPSGMGGGGPSGMGGGGDHMMNMMMMDVPGSVQQMCHMGKDMPPTYCEPSYTVMSSVKGLKISNVNPINDNELEVVIDNINRISNATTMNQQTIVVVGGGGDLAGSTVLDIGNSQKTTTQLKLIGSGSIYSIEKIHVHLLPLTSQ